MSPQFVHVTALAGSVGVVVVVITADAGGADVGVDSVPVPDEQEVRTVSAARARTTNVDTRPLDCTRQLYEETVNRGLLTRPTGTVKTRFVPEATSTPLR